MTNLTGVISSPNYPGPYPGMAHCVWLIEVPQNFHINLTLTDLDIPGDAACTSDALVIYNATIMDPNPRRYRTFVNLSNRF